MKGMRRSALLLTTALVGLAAFGASSGAYAADPTYQFDIPAEPLAKALNDFSQASVQQIIFSNEAVAGRKSARLHGSYTVAQALGALLAGTDLVVETNASGVLMVHPKKEEAASNEGAAPTSDEVETVVVTGTHIRGAAPVGSSVTTYDRSAIDASGAGTLAEFARTIPQNFGSVSNTAVSYGNISSGFGQSGSNAYGGAAFDIHGLGAGSTLTLLDGHRISGGGNDGSFVDTSLIPLSTIQRIEILDDGASAIYGADAVAGVVNLILKNDFDGAESSFRFGDPTDGGGQEVTLSQLLGKSWDTGNVMAAFEYDHQEPLSSSERSFVPPQAQPFDLTNRDDRESALVSGDQQIFDASTTLKGDIYYGKRRSYGVTFSNSLISDQSSNVEQFGGTGSLEHNFAGDWAATLTGNFSRTDETGSEFFPAFSFNNQVSTNTGLEEVDLDAGGPLFSVGSDPIKGAFGTGARHEDLSSSAAGVPAKLHRDVFYAYGELLVPLIEPNNNVPYTYKLELSLAGRYDHYGDFGSTTNPKFGIAWAPVEEISLRGSYATSFRPPQLNQLAPHPEFITLNYVDPSSSTGFTDTLINDSQGNPDLRPETATSYTAGVDFTPGQIPNLKISSTYFRVDFSNRITAPPLTGGLFGGSPYLQQGLAAFINRSPTLAQVQQVFSGPGFFGDDAGGGPSAVKAIFNDEITNLASTEISGIQLSADYGVDTELGHFAPTLAGIYYLDDKYVATPGSTSASLLNLVGEPLRFRARGGLNWSKDGWGSAVFINYSNAYNNPLFTPAERVGSWTTIDLQVSYSAPDGFGFTQLSQTRFSLTVENLFDENPPSVAVPAGPTFNNVGFDALNASPFGRIVALQVTKDF